MNGRTARALRKAIGFIPRANRNYETLQTPQVINYPDGKTQVVIKETVINAEGSPRDQYLKVKEIFKTGDTETVDRIPELEYTKLVI